MGVEQKREFLYVFHKALRIHRGALLYLIVILLAVSAAQMILSRFLVGFPPSRRITYAFGSEKPPSTPNCSSATLDQPRHSPNPCADAVGRRTKARNFICISQSTSDYPRCFVWFHKPNQKGNTTCPAPSDEGAVETVGFD